MSLIVSGDESPLDDIRTILQSSKDEIVIFSPYSNVSSIKELCLPQNKNISIITTLKINDLLAGSTDIELFPFCKDKNIKVFINNKIHLKVFLSDWEKMVFGSSNLTRNGLGYGGSYNYELNAKVDSLNVNVIYYLRKIIAESFLMDDTIYQFVKNKLDEVEKQSKFEEFDFDQLEGQFEKDYLISSLPMTKEIKRLYELVNNNFKSNDLVEVSCAIHDQLLYELPFQASYDEFIIVIKNNFFKSKFIKSLLNFIDEEERYFGAVKVWIQDNCADVPVPSRRDLTGNIQVLYEWIVRLSEGQYVVDRPNHSERIRRIY